MPPKSLKRGSKRDRETAGDASKLAIEYSRYYEGKVQMIPKVPLTGLDDFSLWYTPGVAAVSLAVAKNPDLSFEYTNRWNTLCILTDGSRVLGLGDIGPEASLPVMEGKALIYKYLGGVDAVAIPVDAHEPQKIIDLAVQLEPAFGGIHLEDIASPKCFEILDGLRERLTIPVWHDDQQGTAGVILAALLNSLELTGRKLENSKIVLMGAGAANIAAARLMIAAGARSGRITLVDSKGILHAEREDMDKLLLQNKWKYELALNTNEERTQGGLDEAIRGADALIAASKPGPHTVGKSTLKKMNKDSILFALSNPTPEIWPAEAKKAGVRIVATGRSDFPNQVNNSLVFPSVMRGVFDVRSRAIPDEAIIAAARALAGYSKRKGTLDEDHIIPTMVDWEVYPLIASAVGEKCVSMGIARRRLKGRQISERAEHIIRAARRLLRSLQESKLIQPLPAIGTPKRQSKGSESN